MHQQQQEENFSLLSSSLGDTLNAFTNSFKQYLEIMIRNTSQSSVSADPDLGNRQDMLSEDSKGNRLAKGNAHFESNSGPDALKKPIIPGLMNLKNQTMGIG